ncbi:MAG: heme A synthase [Anaerolineae bacterium]|nr:heme A synthase [Anaerolineae bacterium]
MRSRVFPALALTTALLTVGLIVVGAVVRVTDSGLGCGDHWPLCNGTIFPPLDDITAWIEWSHRLFAMLIGVFGIIMLITAVRNYRHQRRGALAATVIAALMYTAQAGLGAVVVKNELNSALVALHLTIAMLLLGSLLTAALLATYTPAQRHPRDGFTSLVYVTTVLALLIIITGAVVRGSNATFACVTWPLCNGDVLPTAQGPLQMIHMFHRFAVVALGLSLLLLVWSAWKNRGGTSRLLPVLALAAYLAQAGVGAGVVFSGAASVWAAGHVLFAAVTWAFMVALSVIETLNSAERLEGEWHPQSEPLLN